MAILSDEQLAAGLQTLGAWQRADGGDAIVHERKFSDFAEALGYVNRVGEAAEQANHHPDILLHGWNKVRLTLSTHSEGGVTQADLDMAERLEKLP